MSLIKKSDVKNHLSPRNRNGIHLYQPASLPDATGFAGDGSESANPQMKDLAKEPFDQPALTQLDAPSNVTVSDSSHVVAPVTSKSAQA